MNNQKIRDRFDKLPEQRKEVLLKFIKGERKDKILSDLAIGESAYYQHLRLLYKDFGIEGRGEGKARQLVILISQAIPDLKEKHSSPRAEEETSFYIERPPIEEDCCREILKPGALLRIKGPLGMGKSSLLTTKIMPYARSNNYDSVIIDFASFNKEYLTDNIRFLRSFCSSLGNELGLPNKLDNYWDNDLAHNLNATNYLQKYLLNGLASLVLALENVDAVFEREQIRDDFCKLIRSWHNEPTLDNRYSSTWEKVRLVIVHSTDVYGNLDINYSPLANVGTFKELREFTVEEIQQWIQNCGLTWEQERLDELFNLVGGIPWLLIELLQNFQEKNITVNTIFNQEETPNIRYYFSKIEKYLNGNLNLASVFKDVINCESWVKLSKDYAFKLQALGLVTWKPDETGNYVQVKNNFYRQYFRNYLDDLLA